MTLTARGRAVVRLGVVLAVLGALALAGYLYLRSIGLYGTSRPGAPVTVVIPRGASVEDIGRLLEAKDVVPSALGWRITTYVEDGAEEIQAGTYRLRRGLMPRDALAALLEQAPSGDVRYVDVTFPEGAWLTEFAGILARDTGIAKRDFMQVVTSGRLRSRYQPDGVDTLEGLLFPSTYQIGDDEDARAVARRLVDEFEERMGELDLSEARRLGLDPYEVVIVASMIELEARVPSERPKVARVVYNRLEQDIPLGIDATIVYALGRRGATLTESDLEMDSPYNTREVTGLPPTPIGAPGASALEAAAHPADGAWLYYVLADCEGHHSFSVDYDDFLADKAEYQSLEC